MKCKACNNEVIIEKTEIDNKFSYLCMKCGYTADDLNNNIESPSKSIEGLTIIDSEGRKWHPSVFIHQDGILMPNIENEFSWNWIFIPIRKLTEEEKNNDSKYNGYETILDYNGKTEYDRFDFINALKKFGELIL